MDNFLNFYARLKFVRFYSGKKKIKVSPYCSLVPGYGYEKRGKRLKSIGRTVWMRQASVFFKRRTFLHFI